MTDESDDALGRGYRVIRRITGEGESPWPGMLVCDPTGETSVLTDAALVGDEWGGWGAGPDGHVMSPLDVVRRSNGHDVLLPVCTERLEDFLQRRAGTGAPLSTGEGVTVAVSLLRGLSELSVRAHAVGGAWWLSESGRPIFATDTTDTPADAGTVKLLRRLGEDVPELREAIEEACDGLSDARRRDREIARAEDELFAIAPALAVGTTTFGPKRARARELVDAGTTGPSAPTAARRPWVLALARHLDADWADLVSRTTTAAWRSLRRRNRSGRRGPWLAAATIAGAVLLGGTVWPTGADGPATAEDGGGPTAVPTPVGTATPADPAESPAAAGEQTGAEPAGTATPDAPGDLVATTADLLTARTACSDDPACLADVLEQAATVFPEGVVDTPPSQRTLTLLDEFGGVAVLRADAASAGIPAQLVVIVNARGRWLLRDVYDVAEQ